MCYKTTFDSTTNHLNLSPMFLNCLLLDLTVIDLISIVHMDKIWVEIAKNFEMRTSGGRGVKKEQMFADVLYAFIFYGWPPGPLITVNQNMYHHYCCIIIIAVADFATCKVKSLILKHF